MQRPSKTSPPDPLPGIAVNVLDLNGIIQSLVASILADRRIARLNNQPIDMFSDDSSSQQESARECARTSSAGVSLADLEHVQQWVELVRRLMFPGYFGDDLSGKAEPQVRLLAADLTRQIATHLIQLIRSVYFYSDQAREARTRENAAAGANELSRLAEDFAQQHTHTFLSRLPMVRELLSLDVQAAYDGDPAAEHTDEIILCYPGLDAIFAYRIAHELDVLGVPILPRIISEQAHSRTGIDIHPGAAIGKSFFIDHGSGVVVGQTSTIGDHVKIYQGVTLGARSFPKDQRGRVIRGVKRHPTIGNRVTLYAGAVILGGDTTIGDDCVIAGGVFVTSSVPPGHVVQQHRAEPTLKPKQEKGAPGEQPPPRPETEWLGAGEGI